MQHREWYRPDSSSNAQLCCMLLSLSLTTRMHRGLSTTPTPAPTRPAQPTAPTPDVCLSNISRRSSSSRGDPPRAADSAAPRPSSLSNSNRCRTNRCRTSARCSEAVRLPRPPLPAAAAAAPPLLLAWVAAVGALAPVTAAIAAAVLAAAAASRACRNSNSSSCGRKRGRACLFQRCKDNKGHCRSVPYECARHLHQTNTCISISGSVCCNGQHRMAPSCGGRHTAKQLDEHTRQQEWGRPHLRPALRRQQLLRQLHVGGGLGVGGAPQQLRAEGWRVQAAVAGQPIPCGLTITVQQQQPALRWGCRALGWPFVLYVPSSHVPGCPSTAAASTNFAPPPASGAPPPPAAPPPPWRWTPAAAAACRACAAPPEERTACDMVRFNLECPKMHVAQCEPHVVRLQRTYRDGHRRMH